LAIRHDAALNSGAPVFERLWFFWANHFAITEKDFMPEFTTGAYHRDVLRQHMTGSFTDLTKAATTSWAMIHNLDNSESIGPHSENGRRRRERGKVATVNENHARELMELHTVSPAAGYTQDDVIALSYVMAGWEHKYSKNRLECNPVRFNQRNHQPGTHTVLGKKYKQRGVNSSNKLLDAIEDLCAHPDCRRFIALKLCRHFICDNPTDAMMQPSSLLGTTATVICRQFTKPCFRWRGIIPALNRSFRIRKSGSCRWRIWPVLRGHHRRKQ
jgi:uncharacterized protein (DUF1800 family)